MKNKLNLIMPMGGYGSRFAKHGFQFPKPLIEINEKPFFYWSTQSIRKFIPLESLVFIILKEHNEKFNLAEKIKYFFPESKIHIIPEVLNGAVLTCLEGIKEIDNDFPILFNDCDHMFISSQFNEIWKQNTLPLIDGALLTFDSNEPKYSYLLCNEIGNVIQTVEKKVVSNSAICGAYYFSNKKIFSEMANRYLKNCNYEEYFLSGVYNEIISNNGIIKKYRTDFHIPFGTPEEYEIAKYAKEFEYLK